MKLTLKSNLTGGIAVLLFSILLWFIIPLQVPPDESAIVDAQFMPKLIALVLFICALVLIVGSKIKGDKAVEINLHEELRAVIYIIALILYALILPIAGFMVASILLTSVSLIILKSKNWKYYAISVIFVIALERIFVNVLNIPLP